MAGHDAVKYQHGGNIFAAIRQTGLNFEHLLDFSANINPLGLADSIRTVLSNSLDLVIHYPDIEAYALKAEISNIYDVPLCNITLGNGAVELLYVLCHMLKPRKVLIPAPSFSEYERAARAAGADIDYFYLDAQENFNLDIEQLIPYVKKIDILFIGNPNNPTGNLIPNQQLKHLIEHAYRNGTIVVVDESFIDFITDDTLYTCRKLLSEYSNLIILHSLTKFYAIPGLRLGFMLAHQSVTNLLHKGKDPWNVNTLAQIAGIEGLKDFNYRTLSKATVYDAKDKFFNQLNQIPGISAYYPTVNFVLVNIAQTRYTATLLKDLLFTRNILIRDCSNYPGLSNEYIRLAIKLPSQNNKLITELKDLIAGENN